MGRGAVGQALGVMGQTFGGPRVIPLGSWINGSGLWEGRVLVGGRNKNTTRTCEHKFSEQHGRHSRAGAGCTVMSQLSVAHPPLAEVGRWGIRPWDGKW